LRSDRWQLELQFESLKNQISPHYLFNCLNTVSSLLFKDTRVAEEFIRRMADTFRYVLSHQKQKLVSLREELEFVKSYYFLLQVRYEYHLKLEINIPQNILESSIPPMTLQLLVENAVKHNKISKEKPLLVYIGAQDNQRISVSNTKTDATQPVTSFRVGLENIRKRYTFFTNEKVVVRDEEKFLVLLPVLKKTVSNQAPSVRHQTAYLPDRQAWSGQTPSYATQNSEA
jgi:two-component system, LytTR family, sensor kinase